MDESPTANLGDDHGFIINEYYLHWYEIFWEYESKTMKAHIQSGQYRIIVESRATNMVSESLLKLKFNKLNK